MIQPSSSNYLRSAPHRYQLIHRRAAQMIFASLLAAFFIGVEPGAARAEVTPNANNIVLIVRNAKLVATDTPLSATILDRKVLLITDRGKRETDNCKIDAVFMAKTIMEAFPDQVTQVKVIFSHPDSKLAAQVVVTAGDVKAYGSGIIKPDAFLSSIEMSEVGGTTGNTGSTNSSPVVPGPLMEMRLLLLHRIDSLKARGTGVKPFQDLFAQLEQSVQKGDERQVKAQADYLAEKLSEQENLVKQAQAKPTGRPGQGGSVQSAQSSGNAGMTASAAQSELNRRLANWEAKIVNWKKEGRDCDQLFASLILVRGWIATNPEMAKNTLDALDAMGIVPEKK